MRVTERLYACSKQREMRRVRSKEKSPATAHLNLSDWESRALSGQSRTCAVLWFYQSFLSVIFWSKSQRLWGKAPLFLIPTLSSYLTSLDLRFESLC